MRVSWSAASDPGVRRVSNEDALCAREELGLFVVADGMGGHVAGEVASRLAVETIEQFIAETRVATRDSTWPFPFEPALSLEANRLKAAFKLANRRIADEVAAAQSLRGMATTASALLVGPKGVAVAHVGDSRIYLWRDGALTRLTIDHSWVEEQVRAGTLTASAARTHPWRNVVTRAIAGGADPEVDVADVALAPGDRLLLCSDGLFSVVTDERIAEVLASGGPLDAICEALVRMANDEGGPDNVTVLLLQIDAS